MKSKILLRVLSVVLCMVLLSSLGAFGVLAAEGGNKHLVLEETELIPGDTLTQTFKVYTSFFSSVRLHMELSLKNFDEDLADQLIFRIRQEGSQDVLYEAPASQLAKKKASVRVANIFGANEERTYCVEIHVPQDLDNKYQGAALNADFTWRVEETADVIILAIGLVLAALAALAIVFGWKSSKLIKNQKMILTAAVVIVALLGILLSYVFFSVNAVSEKDVRLAQGKFDIVLNDGKPVLGDDILFEPGMVIRKDFTLENKGTANSFYKIYFSELPQELAERINVSIMDGKQTLVSSSLFEMTKETAIIMNDNLLAGEKEVFTLCLELTEEIENVEQGMEYTLDMFVEAAQRENNPEAEFGE